MSDIEMTTSSQKGQIVIPRPIREAVGVPAGTKFAVYGKGDTIVFRKVSLPTKEDFERIVDFGTAFAKKNKITRNDVFGK